MQYEALGFPVHICTERMQPATHWTYEHNSIPVTVRWADNKLLRVQCCGLVRMAKNCAVQSRYDGLSIWCAAGRGCNSAVEIEAKKRHEFRNRSAGQKRRWGRVEK